MTMEKLLSLARSGDGKAFENLYLQTKNAVYAVALSVLRDKYLAEDAMQETYLRLIKGTNDVPNVRSYIAVTARNVSINIYNKQKRVSSLDELQDLCDINSGAGEERSALKAALNLLNEEERQIVLLKNAGYKHRETAKILNMKLGTVTWKYKEAIEKLRNYLEEGDGE